MLAARFLPFRSHGWNLLKDLLLSKEMLHHMEYSEESKMTMNFCNPQFWRAEKEIEWLQSELLRKEQEAERQRIHRQEELEAELRAQELELKEKMQLEKQLELVKKTSQKAQTRKESNVTTEPKTEVKKEENQNG